MRSILFRVRKSLRVRNPALLTCGNAVAFAVGVGALSIRKIDSGSQVVVVECAANRVAYKVASKVHSAALEKKQATTRF
jgi:hypothetical protein